jgi:hypothetical protein
MAITNKEINLAQLSQELGGKGLIGDFNNKNAKIILPADDVDLSEADLETAIKNHIAIDTLAEAKAAKIAATQKLEALGFTAQDLTALGL